MTCIECGNQIPAARWYGLNTKTCSVTCSKKRAARKQADRQRAYRQRLKSKSSKSQED